MTNNNQTVTIDEQTLGQWVMTMAYEYVNGDTYEEWGMDVEYSADPIEYDWEDADVEDVDTLTDDGETVVEVHASTTGTASRKVLSARYNPPGKAHPAEFEVVEYIIEIVARWYPERPMCGDEFTVTVENMGEA